MVRSSNSRYEIILRGIFKVQIPCLHFTRSQNMTALSHKEIQKYGITFKMDMMWFPIFSPSFLIKYSCDLVFLSAHRTGVCSRPHHQGADLRTNAQIQAFGTRIDPIQMDLPLVAS